MSQEFIPDVELAIDLAAREVAKSLSDAYGADFSRVRRNISVLIRAAAAGTRNDAGWLPHKPSDPWVRAAQPGTVDKEILQRAVSKWWDSLDPQAQLGVIMGPAGHHKSEYINNLVQKYQEKPEAELSRDIPDLHKAYLGEAGHGAKQQEAPSA